MKVLFFNVAWMKYYRGNLEVGEEGGVETGEANNFEVVKLDDDNYCFGFAEAKPASGSKTSQLHIEKIEGCKEMTSEDSVDDVLVIFCATHPAHRFTTVVGWYQHATVYREYQKQGDRTYNIKAKASDCVVLPIRLRSREGLWSVPRKKNGASYGFSRSNVWFANDPDERDLLGDFLRRMEKQMHEYADENWMNK